ncbi:MAG: hypothetical protein AAGM33_03430 [Pseudomonadota bacterium]
MSFIKDVSIIGGFKDFYAFVRQSPRERVIPAILAISVTSFILGMFVIDPKVNTAAPPGPKVIYFESWSLDRTDEEILAERWAIQCQKDKWAAKRKESMKELARMSGMDPEEIERDAEAARKARGIVEVVRPAGLAC